MRKDSFLHPSGNKNRLYRAGGKGSDAFIMAALSPEFGISPHIHGEFIGGNTQCLCVWKEGAVVYDSILKLTAGMDRI